nr:phage tail tape measure protein [Heyndrickxia ginsengihumi]
MEELSKKVTAGNFLRAAEVLSGVSDKVIDLGKSAIETGMEMADSQQDIQNNLGLTSKEAEKLQGVAKNVFEHGVTDSVESASKAVQSVKMNMGDLNNSDLEKVTNKIIGIGKHTDTDVNENVRAASQLMNHFGVSADDSLDLIAAGFQDGLNKSDDFLDTLNEYSPQFAQAGFSAKDMLNIIDKGMKSGAFNTDKAADAVKEFGIRLRDGTIEKNIGNYSKTTQELFKKFQDGKATAAQVFQSINKDISNTDDKTKKYALGNAAMGTQYEDLGDKAVDAFAKTGKAIDDVTGKADQMAKRSPGEKWQQTLRQLKDALAPIGQDLVNTLTPVVQMIGSMAKWFSNLPTPVRVVIEVLGALVTVFVALSPLIAAISIALPIIGTILSTLGAIMGGFLALLSGPVLAVIAAVITVITAVILVIKNWGSIIDWLKGIWSGFSSWIANLWQGILTVASNIWGSISAFFSNLWNSISSVASTAWTGFTTWITGIWQGIVSIASTIWHGLVDVFTFIFLLVKEVISAAWTVISSLLIAAWNVIVAMTAPIWQPIATFFATLWNGIKSVASSVWNSLKAFFSTIWNAIISVARAIFNPIKSFFSSIWNAIKSTSSSIWNSIKSVISKVWNGIKSAVQSTANTIKSVVSSIWNGIKSVTSSVWNAIKSVISKVWNSIKSAVQSATNSVKSKVSSVWSGIKSVTSSVWNEIKSVISSVWSSIKTAVSTPINWVKSKVSSVWNSIRSTTSSVWGRIKSAMVSPVNAAKNTISGIISKIKGFFSGLHLHLPKISMPPLPHFHLTGHFSLKPPSVPHLSVDWYKNGGFFDQASIIGIGEAGPEAALPLTGKRMDPFADAVANRMLSTLPQMAENKLGHSVTNNNQIIMYNTVRDDKDIDKIAEKVDVIIGNTGQRAKAAWGG